MRRTVRFAGVVGLLLAVVLVHAAAESTRTLICPLFNNEPPFQTYIVMCNGGEAPVYVSVTFMITDRNTGQVLTDRPTYSVEIPARSIDILDSDRGSSTCGRQGAALGSVSGAVGGFQMELAGHGNLDEFRASAFVVNTDTGDSFPVPVQAPTTSAGLIGVFYSNARPYTTYVVIFNASNQAQSIETKFWSVDRATGTPIPEEATYNVTLLPGAAEIVDTGTGASATGQQGVMVGSVLGRVGGFTIKVQGPEPHLVAATSYVFDQQSGQLFSTPVQGP